MLPYFRFTSFAIAVSVAPLPAQQQSAPHQHHHPPAATYSRSVESYVLPAVKLLDMHGKTVQLASIANYSGPVILQFIFTTCTTVCPIMGATLSAAQDKFGSDLARIRMVSISIDPQTDTPA